MRSPPFSGAVLIASGIVEGRNNKAKATHQKGLWLHDGYGATKFSDAAIITCRIRSASISAQSHGIA